MRLIVLTCTCILLSGCSFQSLTSNGVTTSDVGTVSGKIFGGSQPIAGSHVYLYAAGNGGYGGASSSLLNSTSTGSFPTSYDGTNYYVTTDSNGSFQLEGKYVCTAGTQIYLYAMGGNAGSGSNPNIGLMALLGQCPANGSMAAIAPVVKINEVSTIVAAYSVAGFASDATHIASSSTALAQTGIANAFLTAPTLFSLSGGGSGALAKTPDGTGTVPQALLNSLGNVLAACVSATAPAFSQCSTLFNSARSAGSTGTIPTETATAAINIAHNPANAISAIFGLGAGVSAPFQPTLQTAPNDFTVGIGFLQFPLTAASGLALDSQGNVWVGSGNCYVLKASTAGSLLSPVGGYGVTYPGVANSYCTGLAVDLQDNVWTANGAYAGPVTKISNSGNLLSGSSGFVGGGLQASSGITIDGSGNAWVANAGDQRVSEFSGSGTPVAADGYIPGTFTVPPSTTVNNVGSWRIAADSGGVVWNVSLNGAVSRLSSSGSALMVRYDEKALADNQGFAVDHAGNAWITNAISGNYVVKVAPDGTILSGAGMYGGYAGGGISDAQNVAIDGSGNAWFPNFTGGSANTGSISELSNSGVPISGAKGYGGGNPNSPFLIAIDGSGNVWTVSGNNVGSLYKLVGAAIPVVTPLAAGAANNTQGTRP